MKICVHNDGLGRCGISCERCTEGPCDCEELIEYAPVRHGRWLDNEDYMFCSVCGMQWYYCDNETQDFKFCPNCGAKMDALTFEEASRKLGQQAAETLKKLKEAGYA